MSYRKNRQPRGVSLIEAALCIVIVFLTVSILFGMLGAPRQEDTSRDNPTGFGSASQELSLNSKEYVLANSLVEDVLAGHYTDDNPDRVFVGTNQRCSLPIAGLQPSQRNDADDPNVITNSRASVCVDRNAVAPIYYRWDIRRVVTGNGLSGNGTDCSNGGCFRIPRRVFRTGTALDNFSYNEYYLGTLKTFKRQADATANINSTFTVPFSFYRNNFVPDPLRANVVTNVAADTSLSTFVREQQITGRSLLLTLRAALGSYFRTVQTDRPNGFLGPQSRLGFQAFQGDAPTEFVNASDVRALDFQNFRTGIACIKTLDVIQNDTALINEIAGDEARCLNNGFSLERADLEQDAGLGFDRPLSDLDDGSIDNTNRQLDKVLVVIMAGPGPQRVPSVTGYPGNRNDIITRARASNITIFTVGAVSPPIVNDELRRISEATRAGLHFDVSDTQDLDDALDQIASQSQFFALRKKAERYGPEL